MSPFCHRTYAVVLFHCTQSALEIKYKLGGMGVVEIKYLPRVASWKLLSTTSAADSLGSEVGPSMGRGIQAALS